MSTQMLHFNDYFEDEYQFSLKDVSYTKTEGEALSSGYELKIADTLWTEQNGDALSLVFARDVHFEPESLFKLRVAFDILLRFKENAPEAAGKIYWRQELLHQPNPYLGNVVSRASHLIAEITASFGQQPFITPPNPIIPEENPVAH